MNLFDKQPLSSVPDNSLVKYDGREVEYLYSYAGKATMYERLGHPEDTNKIFYLHDTTEVQFVRKL